MIKVLQSESARDTLAFYLFRIEKYNDINQNQAKKSIQFSIFCPACLNIFRTTKLNIKRNKLHKNLNSCWWVRESETFIILWTRIRQVKFIGNTSSVTVNFSGHIGKVKRVTHLLLCCGVKNGFYCTTIRPKSFMYLLLFLCE